MASGTELSGTHSSVDGPRSPRCGSRLRWTKHEVIMAALTRNDVVAVLKPAEDTVVAQIIATGATKEELAEAYAWMQSDETLMNAGRPLPFRPGRPDHRPLAGRRG